MSEGLPILARKLQPGSRVPPGGAFAPTDDWGRGIAARINISQVLEIIIRRPRNGQMHKKFWALVHVVWQSTGRWDTPYELLKQLKRMLGLYEDWVDPETGIYYREYQSISYAKMDQTEFEVFYERALNALCELAGEIDRDTLRQEVLHELTLQ